jgi:cell wall-associated NlpC family hydrolase
VNLLLVLLFAILSSVAGAESQSAVVVVPVADVWNRPLAATETPTDDLRETQVLFGEHVLIHESSGPWVHIEAVEQPTFRQHNKWEDYPGWALKKVFGPVPLEKKIAAKPSKDILTTAQSAIGVPYLWGGLSQQGIDCSGLVHLAYREYGMTIPRDAHEQWMKARPIKRVELKPADLIFSAKADNPKTITHVALYAGDGQIIEAPQAGLAVRKISFKEKYGKALDEVESGDRVGDRVIYFGSYLPK